MIPFKENDNMKIFAGKLSKYVTEADLKNVFEKFGHVTSIYILRFGENGDSFLYGIIEMPVKKQALAAIKALNGKEIKGMLLNVHPARVGPENRRKGGRGGGRRFSDPPQKKT